MASNVELAQRSTPALPQPKPVRSSDQNRRFFALKEEELQNHKLFFASAIIAVVGAAIAALSGGNLAQLYAGVGIAGVGFVASLGFQARNLYINYVALPSIEAEVLRNHR
jgi:hypothetical protein